MASDQGGKDITRIAGADLSAKQYHFVLQASDGEIDAVASAGGVATGVLQDNPNAQGKAARVRVNGSTKLKVGGTVAAGAKLQSDASGQGITAASADHVLAQAQEAGVDGDIIEALLISQHILA